MTYTVTIEDMKFEVQVESWSAFDPGINSGPPENCYPPEGGEIEWRVSDDFEGNEFINAALDKNPDWSMLVFQQLYEQLMDKEEY